MERSDAYLHLHTGPTREAAVYGLLALAGLILGAFMLQRAAGLPGYAILRIGAAFLLVLVAVLIILPTHHPHAHFGAANLVTLLRAALVALLLGFVGADTQPSLAWSAVGIATVAAILDAVDGPLARRQGLSSAFGARFDMETDAALVMILSILVWQFDKAGPWVLASGLMRYVFVMAGWLMPWLRGTLPLSMRRQAICVAQVIILIVSLAPIVPLNVSAALAAIGLVALAGSFAIDVGWLARNRRV
jgi:phosphatidylglycerophosphate synthase